MPEIKVTPDMMLADNGYHVRLKPRAQHSEVKAKWQDRGAGHTRQVVLQAAQKGPSMTLREVFQSEADAQKACEAKARELRAGEGELTVELIGNPEMRAEAPVSVSGVDPDADGQPWVSTNVTHVWDFAEGGGASTTVEAEFGMDEKGDKKGATKKSSSGQTGEYVSILDR